MATRDRHRPRSSPERSGTQTKRRKKRSSSQQTQKKVSPEVIYLPPKPMARSRFFLQLATVVAVVLALIFSLTLFFEVREVLVNGTAKYTPYEIWQASGIAMKSETTSGDGLLTFNRAQAAAKIKKQLPYVDTVRFDIRLPGTVIIDIVEVEVAYSVEASDGSWWLISSAGKVVERAQDGEHRKHTQITGVRLLNPALGEIAHAYQPEPEGDTPVVTSEAKRLTTALDIATYLEGRGIIGKVVSLDVSNLGDIQMWYGQQYLVKFGDDSQLSYKVEMLDRTIASLQSYQSGILDISFTVFGDQVGFSKFE